MFTITEQAFRIPENPIQMKAIPDDVWIKIFKELDFKNWKNLSLVDKNLSKISPSLQILEPLAKIEAGFRKIFVKIFGERLTQLTWRVPKLTHQELTHILSSCHNLKKLRLSRQPVTDDILQQYIAKMSSLQDLQLRICKQVTNEGIQHLKTCTSIEILDLEGCEQITDEGLQYFPVALQFLGLSGCQITNCGLSHLTKLSSLRELKVINCNKITNQGLENLAMRIGSQLAIIRQATVTIVEVFSPY